MDNNCSLEVIIKKLLLISVLMLFVVSLTGCGVLKAAAELEDYIVGGESIPSITSVIGTRKVTGVKSSTSNGITTKQYDYSSESVYDDLFAYVTLLLEDEGWLVTQDIDLADVPGSGELGIKSADDGQILLMTLSFNDSGYEIKIVKGEGTIDTLG